MKRLFVMAERSKSICTPSRDEELTPLPAGMWFDNLKAAFEWADSSNLLGDLFGWQANVYLLTNKSLIRITKVTEKMIYEDELREALGGLKAAYYVPAAERIIASVPASDVEPVIRCKDCKYKPTAPEGITEGNQVVFPYDFDNPCPCQCGDAWYSHKPDDDFFCAYGARKEDDDQK